MDLSPCFYSALHQAVAFLHYWQELAAAIITALIGIVAAVIVSMRDQHRQLRTAGFVVVLDLNDYLGSVVALEERWQKEKSPNTPKTEWYGHHIAGNLPDLSPLFEQNMVQLAPLDNGLAGHLGLFLKLYKQLSSFRMDLRQAYGPPPTQEVEAPAYALAMANAARSENLALDAFLLTGAHAACARDLIETLVLDRRWWWPFARKKYNPACVTLLERGERVDPDEPSTNYMHTQP